jgi:hypothetical protein
MNEPTEEQINALLNQCADAEDSGQSKYPGMSYEQGISAAIRWMQGDEPHPLDD